jgi:hypothetical protein
VEISICNVIAQAHVRFRVALTASEFGRRVHLLLPGILRRIIDNPQGIEFRLRIECLIDRK